MSVISVNLSKAKVIAHTYRRAARAQEFAPYDQVVSLQIPGENTANAEAARAAIRTKYNALQAAIDSCTDVAVLQSLVGSLLN